MIEINIQLILIVSFLHKHTIEQPDN